MVWKKTSNKSGTKRILVVTERFFPEEFLINDLVSEWQQQGFQINVLTQTPSYPFDKIFDGYSNRLFQSDEWNGIAVSRVKTIIGYNKKVSIKIINYLCFACLTSLWCLLKGRKYDRVFVYHTGPLTMATCAIILRYIHFKKCFIWTQDVWPDTVYAYGFAPTWWRRWLLNSFVFIIYSAFKQVFITSPAFEKVISKYTSCKITYIPQWYSGKQFNTKNGFPEKTNKKKVFLFAGNIGSVQNLDVLVQAFGELRFKNAELRIVGDGVYLQKLKDLAAKNNYTNITFTGRLPFEKMPEVLSMADVLIIALQDKAIFALTIPAKFQVYLAAGKAIMAAAPGAVKDLVVDNQVGLSAKSGSLDDIQNTFQEFMNIEDEKLLEFGRKGREMSESIYSRDKIIKQITDEIWN